MNKIMDKKEDIMKLWHENVDSILAKQSPKRREREQKRIQIIRELMSDSSLGKDLLDWADDKGITILMDKQVRSNGYYCDGLKTVVLSTNVPNGELIGTLAHEIRHAWQDDQGLLPTLNKSMDNNSAQTAIEYMVQVRFLEADASAVGNTVLEDVIEKRGKLAMLRHMSVAAMILHVTEAKVSLEGKFKNFFSDTPRKDAYDEHSLKNYATYMDIPNIVMPSGKMEYDDSKFHRKHNIPSNIGLNVYDEASIRKLGEIFNQDNYMNNLPKNFHQDPFYSAGFSLRADDSRLLKRVNTIKNRHKTRKL